MDSRTNKKWYQILTMLQVFVLLTSKRECFNFDVSCDENNIVIGVRTDVEGIS